MYSPLVPLSCTRLHPLLFFLLDFTNILEPSALPAASSDALVAIYTDLAALTALTALTTDSSVDKDFGQSVTLVPSASISGGRLVLSPTGSLNDDADDVRKFSDAVKAGIARAVQAGSTRPALLLVQPPPSTNQVLDADYSRWVEKLQSIDLIFGQPIDDSEVQAAVVRAKAIETGRQRMTPYNCAQTIEEALKNVPGVKYTEIKDLEVIKREYPLLYNSARASFSEKRTWPCVYRSPEPAKVKEHLYLVGKGVTYDTGGISLKIGGSMRGMSRDKLGACGVAGFVLATGIIQEPSIIVSRAGVRVLINDTDAEGRLVMTDPVAECRERIMAARAAGDKTPAAIYTAATLTGHVIHKYDRRLAVSGLAYGDPFENSIMRREDYQFVESKTDREDVYQSNASPSTLTDRGHQYPAAFIIKASGLDKHSLKAGEQDAIPFVHVDIAGSAEDGVELGQGLCAITGSPVATFAGAFWTSAL
ncbi:hypothetical protein BX661DRAFT_186678 [Kickxella alabastrina]|uniref:uncharacterized protein n=1 Tax=Kickxella alabastrina TaxID=61397 RepID=UPI0022203A01|nr:uncharacterized protein BX661DRAFT_186678 [Kickxella alabastrina]KAI7823467.1 hypothetical protein BX661DRAFT_186678 [Kickxella alabastrina]